VKIIAPALGTMLLAMVASPPAKGLDLLSTSGSGPAGNCQPSIPSGNTAVRKRPLAVINEGTGSEFVTCAFTTEEVSINVVGFGTRISNISAVPATVNCTAVVGEELENAQYFVKSITLAPGAAGQLTWGTGDTGGLLFAKSVALSCILPPFVGVNRNRITTLLSIL